MNVYEEWGFNENPFSPTPLQPNEEGKKLLIGRDEEIKELMIRLFNPPSLVTVEGANGIGKSSLINATLYECYEDYFNQRRNCLFIPCYKNFQISLTKDPEEFVDDVLVEVAQTLLMRADELTNLGFEIPDNSTSIDKWLNSPMISNFQVSIGNFGVGFGSIPNDSSGFARSGFRSVIRGWLQTIFPVDTGGGVVCTIDNLEILETTDTARKLVEQLRDLLFNLPGIRWILCGASGIVKSIGSSQRLEGLLHDPIEIMRINQNYAKSIFDSRMEYCSYNSKFYMPLTEKNFVTLFSLFAQNVRTTFKYANDYCIYIHSKTIIPRSESEKDSMFSDWLNDLSNHHLKIIVEHLSSRALIFFKKILKYNNSFSLCDYKTFSFESITIMEAYLNDLATIGVIKFFKEENDYRRKSIQLTSIGYFVGFAMNIIHN